MDVALLGAIGVTLETQTVADLLQEFHGGFLPIRLGPNLMGTSSDATAEARTFWHPSGGKSFSVLTRGARFMALSRAAREWAIDLFLVSPKGAIVNKISLGNGRRGRLPQVQKKKSLTVPLARVRLEKRKKIKKSA